MGKIATKCCRPCEAGNEVGNANLEQHYPILDNNKSETLNNNFLAFIEEENAGNKAKANFNPEIDSFTEKYKCNFSLKILS